MKKYTFIIIVLIAVKFSFSQNLVPNPSFEEYSSCPTQATAVYLAVGWFHIRPDADYYNVCSKYFYTSIPNHGFGYQCPATGNAYVGIIEVMPHINFLNNTSEMFGCKLKNKLIKGNKYFVSFKVNNANNTHSASNNIGMLFSTKHYNKIAPINNFAQINSAAIIYDTLNWTTIKGSFIADSAYEYITIGNFFDTLNTKYISFDNQNINTYYYIDDIYVGTDSIESLNIKSEILDFKADTTDIKQGSCVNFNVNSIVKYSSYKWSFYGAIPDTSSSLNPINICYPTPEIYNVQLIAYNKNGCGGDTIIKKNYINVGFYDNISKKDIINKLQIKENPVKDKLIIQSDLSVNNVKIYNIIGKLILEQKINNNSDNVINISEFENGLYILKAESKKQIYINKFLKN